MINDKSIWEENKNTLPNPKSFKQEEIVKCDITNETKSELKKEILKVTTKIKKVKIKYLYLMVKKHKLTGLKYLCKKITHSDKKAISYTGSGSYWLSHIKKHGKYIDTEILVKMNLEECKKFQQICLKFSENFNIVDSNEWANLIPENGRQGGIVGKYHFTKTKEFRENFSKNNPCKNSDIKEKLRIANIGEKNPFYGKTHSDEFKLKLKIERTGIKNPKSDKNIYSFKYKNTNYIISGTRYKIIELSENINNSDPSVNKINRKDLCRWFLNNGKKKNHIKGWYQI